MIEGEKNREKLLKTQGLDYAKFYANNTTAALENRPGGRVREVSTA